MNGKSRLIGLELLRFVLAASVMANHYFYFGPITGQISAELYSFDFLVYGRFAVPVFFIISGFVIMKSAARKTWYEFAAARVSRLYPALIICASITLLALVLSGQENLSRYFFLWTKSASFWGIAADGDQIDPSYWSLVYEWRFYIMVAVLIVISRLEQAEVVLTLMSVFGLLGYLGQVMFDWLPVILFPHTTFFAIGVLFYSVTTRGWSPLIIGMLLLNFAIAGFGVHVDYGAADMLHDGVRSPLLTGYVIAFCSVALFVIFLKLKIPSGVSAFVLRLGAMSYPLYLIHQVLGYIIIIEIGGTYVAAWSAVGASLLIAFVVAKYLEPVMAPMIRTALLTLRDRLRSRA